MSHGPEGIYIPASMQGAQTWKIHLKSTENKRQRSCGLGNPEYTVQYTTRAKICPTSPLVGSEQC